MSLGIASLLLPPARPMVLPFVLEDEELPALPPEGLLGSVVLLVSVLAGLALLSELPQPNSSWLPARSPAAVRNRPAEMRGQSAERFFVF